MFSFPNLVLVAGASLAAAVVALVFGDGSWWRRILFVVLVGVWAGRLAWYVSRRNHGKGEDPRYAKMLAGVPDDKRFGDE